MMFASLAFEFGAVIFRKPSWRVVGFWTLIVAAVLCVPTILSGLTGLWGWFHVDPYMSKPSDTLLKHRNVALIAGIIVVLMAIWRTASIERKHAKALNGETVAIPRAEFAVYLVVLILATAGIGWAGYLGAYVAQGA
jgi:uncharacterized membrane protein